MVTDPPYGQEPTTGADMLGVSRASSDRSLRDLVHQRPHPVVSRKAR